MIKFEDVKEMTTEEYFNGNIFSIDAFNKKYALYKGETYVYALKRVCDFVASVEKTDELKKYWSERWFDEIFSNWWHPAGSIMQGAGSKRKISLANCFSQDTEFITDRGTKNFGNFKDGDSVKVLTHYGDYKDATIKNFGKQKLYKLTVSRNDIYKEVKCTIDHIWRTLKSDTIVNKTTGTLEIGDLLPYVKNSQKDKSKAQWKVISVDETDLYEDVWCVIEPETENFTLSGGLNTHNCTTISMGTIDDKNNWDNLESIIKNAGYTVAKAAAYRQGLGIDFSSLRPNGALVSNSANESTGAIHWMKLIDSMGYYVGQKGRIPAMLFSLNIKHPDIEEFIKVKSDYTKIQNANISVQITNEFYSAVYADLDWEVKFIVPSVKKGDKIYMDAHSIDMDCIEEITDDNSRKYYKVASHDKDEEIISKKINARKLLLLIAENMFINAEPGIQNIDIAREYSNSDAVYDPNDEYDSRIISTNACCVVDTTSVITNKGSMSIKELYDKIKNNEKISVMSYNIENDVYEFKPILNAWQQRNDTTVELEIQHNEIIYKIECSADHPILTSNRGYVEAISLTDDDDIVIYEYKMGKLLSIKIKSDIKPLYDIEVQDNNNFIVNEGIVIHNSEQYLSRESLCVLASQNAEKFSKDEDKLKQEQSIIASSMIRFLDNVNECELVHKTYATPHQRLAIEKLRRTGAGITNIGGYLFKINTEYGSDEANKYMETYMKWYNYYLYKYNIELGKEKGNFELFNSEKILKSKFMKNLISEFPELKFDSMRCVTCSSIAPAGTLTLMFRDMPMSYGIEPGFGIYYWKRTRISGKYEYYFTVPHSVRTAFECAGYKIPITSDTIKDTWDGKYGKSIAKFIDDNKNKVGIKFKNSTDVFALDKLKLMSKMMKWVDSSISVTYMLPENTKIESVYDFILKAYEKGVKSIAAFPDRKMYGIISLIPFRELAFKLKSEGVEIHSQNFDDKEAQELQISSESILPSSSAPKRPKSLPADIYSVTVKGEKFVVAIGLLNKSPYEIFCGKMNGLNFKFSYKTGVIEKVKRGQYKLEIGDDIVVEDFSGYFKPVEANLFRMVSTSLRHGVPLKFVVEQLNKSQDDISSLTSAAARVLKKYIKEGEIVTGIICPSCGSTVIYDETGCNKCIKCSWSKCS